MKYEHFSSDLINDIKGDVKNNYFTEILNDSLSKIPIPLKICDIGCGNGLYSAILKYKIDCMLVGIDGSLYALEEAKKLKFDELYYVEDFSKNNLPFEEETFDLIINKDVLEHLVNPKHLVSEMSRILKKNGHLIIHVPNHFPIIGRVRLLLNNSIDTFNYFPNVNRGDFPHIRFFTWNDLIALLEFEGFELVTDMNWRFFQCGRFQKLFPLWVKKWLCNRNPDAWTEGYTALLKLKR